MVRGDPHHTDEFHDPQRHTTTDGLLLHTTEMYRVVWSPSYCMFDRREAEHRLLDVTDSTPYDRCVTYEGGDTHGRQGMYTIPIPWPTPVLRPT